MSKFSPTMSETIHVYLIVIKATFLFFFFLNVCKCIYQDNHICRIKVHVSVTGAGFALPLRETCSMHCAVPGRDLAPPASTRDVMDCFLVSCLFIFSLLWIVLSWNFDKLSGFLFDIFTCLTIQHPSVWPINWACLGSVCDGLQSMDIIYFIVYLDLYIYISVSKALFPVTSTNPLQRNYI